eukprot:3522459-Pleurochrysis_carterae.AAC.1
MHIARRRRRARSADPSFGMVELEAQACAGDGTLSLKRGIQLFEKLLHRLSRPAIWQRTRVGAPPVYNHRRRREEHSRGGLIIGGGAPHGRGGACSGRGGEGAL